MRARTTSALASSSLFSASSLAQESDLAVPPQQMSPIENMYYILRRYNVRLPKEETDTLFNIRRMWKELLALGQVRSSKLSHLQAGFRREVVRNVKSFSLEVMQFCNDFDMNGPMVAGLVPVEAQERLKKYSQIFEGKRQRMTELQEREVLFGTSLPRMLSPLLCYCTPQPHLPCFSNTFDRLM